jgi:ubiquinone/menaquinone biosynthesis C-methylase UbiE
VPLGYSPTSRIQRGATFRLFGSRLFSRAIEFRIIARWLGPQRGLVLDLAAGTGEFAVQFALLGFRVVALDLDLPALRRGKDEDAQDIKWIGGDATRLPFVDGAFDVVVCNSALEHIAEEERAVDEMQRVLKPGGRLILTTDSFPRRMSRWVGFTPSDCRHDGLQGVSDLRRAIEERHRRRHRVVRFYQPDALIRQLEDHALHVEAWRYYLNGPISKGIYELHLIWRRLDFYNFLSRRLYPLFFPFTFPILRRRDGYGIAVMATRAERHTRERKVSA